MLRPDIVRRTIIPGRIKGIDEGNKEATRFHQSTHLVSPVCAPCGRDGDEEPEIMQISRQARLLKATFTCWLTYSRRPSQIADQTKQRNPSPGRSLSQGIHLVSTQVDYLMHRQRWSRLITNESYALADRRAVVDMSTARVSRPRVAAMKIGS